MKVTAVTATVVLAMAAMATVARADGGDLARGWGDSVHWRSFEDAQEEAAIMHKPIMMVIHKSWCGACKALKPKFAASARVAELSNHFVMTNLMDDEEPQGAQYRPDGGYIPRILFLDWKGNVVPELQTPRGNPQYKYFYSTDKQIVDGMNNAMKFFARPEVEEDSTTQPPEAHELPDVPVDDMEDLSPAHEQDVDVHPPHHDNDL